MLYMTIMFLLSSGQDYELITDKRMKLSYGKIGGWGVEPVMSNKVGRFIMPSWCYSNRGD